MQLRLELSGMGTRPYPLDRERRRRVFVTLAEREMNITILAKNLCLSRSYVSEIISGRDLALSVEKRIAEFLGKPAGYLFPPRSVEEIAEMRIAEASEKGKAA